jgi:hypothetical protein
MNKLFIILYRKGSLSSRLRKYRAQKRMGILAHCYGVYKRMYYSNTVMRNKMLKFRHNRRQFYLGTAWKGLKIAADRSNRLILDHHEKFKV